MFNGSRASWWLDAAAIFALTAVLVLPVFKLEYLANWSSIEGSFIAQSHLLQQNWAHHLWQPFWYCGTRSDYVYPPGPRYAAAILSTLFRVSAARGYHLFIGFFYAFGFVVLYVWVRAASGSRLAAWLAAATIAVASPSFLVLPDIRNDSIFRVPQRLHVLMTYGEGPHISSLAMLPVAWLGAWKRFHGGSARWLCLSAFGIALTVTINFYGLMSVAITMPLLVWACLLESKDWRVVLDGAIIAVLAWGLTAWWLVPSYLQVTGRNLHLVSPAGNSWSVPAAILVLLLYFVLSLLLRRVAGFSAYAFFIWSAFWWISVYILGFRWFGLQISGDPVRLVPELDVFAILSFVHLGGIIWRWSPPGLWKLVPRVALLVLLFYAYRPSWRYIKHLDYEFPKSSNWSRHVEYQTESWLHDHFPDERVFVTGTIRFWYDVWHDGQESDGASQQGTLNPLLPAVSWLVTNSPDPKVILGWLQAVGVDILVVPGKSSQEAYKDFANPKLFDAFLPLLRDDGEGNRYYRVPRGSTGIARVVDRARLEAVPPILMDGLVSQIAVYAQAVESRPAADPVRLAWRGSDAMDVTVQVAPGEALLVQETYDPNWRAYENGRAQEIERDAVGNMLVPLAPGAHSLRMVFETPGEVIAGRIAAIVSLLAIAFLLTRRAQPRATSD